MRANCQVNPPAQAIYLSAAFTSPSKKLKVFWMMEKIMLNKYLFVCHVGCGPFPQKNRVFRMHVKATVFAMATHPKSLDFFTPRLTFDLFGMAV